MQLRVVDVTYFTEVTRIDENGNEFNETVDLSLQGRFVVHVEYLDDAGTVIQTTTADFPADISEADALARLQETGRKIDAARTRVGELEQYEGQTFAV